MLYKLDRISRLLERDIRDADTQFTIWLAMRLSTLAATAEMVDRDVSSG
jgi:DNA-binding PucR family transcriptional regulator